MHILNRRQFLQMAGGTLAAIGLDQSAFLSHSQRQSQVLAQSSGDKLALLIGINEYPAPLVGLNGCVTDVEMQHALLVHRYGFNPNNIKVLTNSQATRQQILNAFEEHLIKQAQPGDVVVFHYSGHGYQVIDNDPIVASGLNGTICPVDSQVHDDGSSDDIMGKTLFLLSKQIKTEHLTMVLDSCHSGGGLRGNVRFRAANRSVSQGYLKPSSAELSYQNRQLEILGLSPNELKILRKKGIARGAALGSAQQEQKAVDVPFEHFYAGAFTYLLTQYLWQLPQAESISQSFGKLKMRTRDVAESYSGPQNPIHKLALPQHRQRPIYFTSLPRPYADAVVIPRLKAEGKHTFPSDSPIQFWLGGLSARTMPLNPAQGNRVKFELIDERGNATGRILEQTGRIGMRGYGRLLGKAHGSIPPGTLLREQLRELPQNLTLTIGLDPALGQQVNKLHQALENSSRIRPVLADNSQPIDYLLARLTPENRSASITALTGSIGLFTSSMVPVNSSFLSPPEAASSTVIKNLQPRFRILLAHKVLGGLVNSSSSKLEEKFSISTLPPNTRELLRTQSLSEVPSQPMDVTQPQRAGTIIKVSIENQYRARNLYVGVLMVSDSGEISVMHPTDWESPDEASLVDSSSGRAEAPIVLRSDPPGYTEILTIASTKPLRRSLRLLKRIATTRGGNRRGSLSFNEATTRNAGESEDTVLDFAEQLVSDLGTRAGGETLRADSPPALRADEISVHSTILQVVD